MQFVNPFFLFGLLAVGIPILVHLFNFRRFRRVYFTNVRFLEELKLQTQKQSRIKHLLVLLMRILATICLVLAFAQPYIPVSRKAVNDDIRNQVSIYVDNSFSMEARSPHGSLLDDAKRQAAEIAMAYKPGDLFQLVTSSFEGRHQRFVSREEFLELLQEVKIASVSRDISSVTSRQKDMLSTLGKSNKIAYIISDFQYSVSDLSSLKPDSSVQHFLIPVKGNQSGNVYVDSCWLESPVIQLNQQVRMLARVKNSSSSDYEKIPVKLFINGTQRAVASLNCKAMETAVISLSYTNNTIGIQNGYLEIVDYPTVWDDRLYFSYPVFDKIPVLSINDKNDSPFLNGLFGRDSTFSYQSGSLRTLDYSSLKNYTLIILNEVENIPSGLNAEVKNFFDQGGSLVVIPPATLDMAVYSSFLSLFGPLSVGKIDTVNTSISEINITNPLYRGVFEKVPENINLPLVLAHYPINSAAKASTEVLLKLQNGDPFLTSLEASRGHLYILSSPLKPEFGNFARHAIFVPTFFQMAMLSQSAGKLFYTIGANEAIEYRGKESSGENVYKIKNLQANVEFIPEYRSLAGALAFFPHDQLKEAGNYSLLEGNTVLKGLSFNYDRKESDMHCRDAAELNKMINDNKLKDYTVLDTGIKPLSQTISELSRGIRFWKLFAFLTLFFLFAEVGLLRFWK
ncbi:MAG: BatA and WFA domain-containing protein [Bacteroidota bacterium]